MRISTLTEADLAACRPIVGEGGHVLRALCPFHGSDRQRSLRVQVHSGRFVCFACGAWGYMETARAQWREEQQRQAALQKPPAYRQRIPHRRQPPLRLPRQPAAATRKRSTDPPTPRAPAPARPDLAQQLAAFQAALPGSRGEAYLQQRGIPLELAQQLGVGYAAPGTWPGWGSGGFAMAAWRWTGVAGWSRVAHQGYPGDGLGTCGLARLEGLHAQKCDTPPLRARRLRTTRDVVV